MKLEISGTEYDYARAMSKARLSDLYDLKIQANIGVRTVRTALDMMDEATMLVMQAKQVDGADEASIEAARLIALEIHERAEVIIGVAGLVFLCKRHAGEKVTFEESQVSFDELRWVVEDSDAVTDPTEAPVEEAAPGLDDVSDKSVQPSPRKSSKTSKKPSTGD